MKSEYIIQNDEKSFCPKCAKPLDLLCERNPRIRLKDWFYICWDCKLIAQVGAGPAERMK
jgi:hypothetical protein